MIIYYILLMSGAKADISYNTAWMGLWVLAEISLGIIVSCTFSLPRFVEAEGPRFRTVYRSVTKPLTSIPGFGSLLAYSKIDSSLSNTATQDVVALDQVHPETRQYFQAIDDAVELNHPHGSKKEWNEIS